MRSKFVAGLLGVLFIILTFSGCNSIPKEPVIGLYLPPAGDDFEGKLIHTARMAAQDAAVQVVEETYTADSALTTQAMQRLIKQKVHAVVMYAQDEAQIQEAATLLKKKKIPLVLVGTLVTFPDYTELVTYDNYAIGAQSALTIAKRLEGKGNVLILKGIPGSVTDQRTQGFMQTMEQYPDITIVASESAGNSRDLAYSLTQVQLAAEEINAVFAQDDEMAIGAIDALEEELYDPAQIVTGIGGSKEALALIMKNHRYFKATWEYHPDMAGEAVTRALRIIRREEITKDELLPTVQYTAKDAVACYNEKALY